MILYYSHNAKPRGFLERIYQEHRAQAERVGQRFVAIVAERFASDDIILPFAEDQPKFTDIYLRIMRGLDFAQIDDYVYLAEDDVLYPDNRYFWEIPDERRVTYNLNIVYLCERGFFIKHQNAIALSQLMGTSKAMMHNIGIKLKESMTQNMRCVEPCSSPGTGYLSGTTRISPSAIDFRTGHNASWSEPGEVEYFQKMDGWGESSKLWNEIYKGEK